MSAGKKKFNWDQDRHLTPDLYDPLGDVRDVGFTKLADGLLADPVKRKKKRKERLLRQVSVVDRGIIVEESSSGLHGDVTPSDADRLIGRGGAKITGLNRFRKKIDKKTR